MLFTRKKQIFAIIFSILLGLTACGTPAGNNTDTEVTNTNTPQPPSDSQNLPDSQTPDDSQNPGDSQGPANSQNQDDSQNPDDSQSTPSGDKSDPSVPELPVGEFALPESEALDFVHNLTLGWNLGNTLDAIDCTWLSNEMDYESAWNGQKTTKEHITAIKNAGFRSIRIPVSWHNHLSDSASYTISRPWLDRVNEIVDYCIDQDMYVIINIHHDNSKEFLYPSSQDLDRSVRYVTAIWQQVSERFRDYDEHLIFEALNEPRLVGHPNEWWIDPNSADCKDAIQCINQLNQAFVDTVRASGGSNKTRYLMCPGYAASPDGALNDGFVLPKDSADNDHRIIVSAHAYIPYNFALESPGTSSWSSANKTDVNNMVGFMNNLYNRFTSKGIPVIIGEFGAMEKNGNLSARVDFASFYVAAARARGITCFWWDNNCFEGDGERFGLFDRASGQIRYPEISQGMVNYAK